MQPRLQSVQIWLVYVGIEQLTVSSRGCTMQPLRWLERVARSNPALENTQKRDVSVHEIMHVLVALEMWMVG